MRTLTSRRAPNMRALMPGVSRIASPTMQITDWPVVTVTSAMRARSASMSASAGVWSMVSETLTSLVATMSTGVR